MKEWKYLIGSADDFIGAPDWATLKTRGGSGALYFVERHEDGRRALSEDGNISKIGNYQPVKKWPEIIAQRTESFGNAIDLEFCKSNPDHPDCKCKEESKVSDKNIGTLTYKVGLDLSELYGQSQALADAVRDLKVTLVNNSSDSIDLQVDIDDKSLNEKYKIYTINIDDNSSKYSRQCKGVAVDVYDVLQAFAVTNPATQHAIKKLLCAGLRGHKDKMQDLTEALKSIERAIELEKE